MQGSGVEHRDEDAAEGETEVESVAHLLDRVGEQRQTAQTEVLALHRDDHCVGAGKGVHGEQPERWLAIDQNDVVAVENGMQRPAEGLFASDFADELDLGGRQIDVRRQKVEVLDARTHQHILDRRVRRDQQVVDGLVELVMRHAETRGQRTLRIEVDKQYASPVLGERGTQVDRRRRLADAALLIAHGDDGRRSVSVEGRRRRNVAVGTPGGADLVVGMIALVDVDAGRHMKAVLIVGMTSRPRCTRCAHVPAFLTDHVSTPLVSLMVHCTEAVEHRRTALSTMLSALSDGPWRTPHASC